MHSSLLLQYMMLFFICNKSKWLLRDSFPQTDILIMLIGRPEWDGQQHRARKCCSHRKRPKFQVNQHNLNSSSERKHRGWMEMQHRHRLKRKEAGSLVWDTLILRIVPGSKWLLGNEWVKRLWDCPLLPWTPGILAIGDPISPMDICMLGRSATYGVDRDRASASVEPEAFVHWEVPVESGHWNWARRKLGQEKAELVSPQDWGMFVLQVLLSISPSLRSPAWLPTEAWAQHSLYCPAWVFWSTWVYF